MAVTIDYLTRIISVPKADLTLIQSTPFEILELDINAFRLELKDIEDNIGGMPFVDTHRHFTTVTVGGVTLARVFEVINGYSVTFENGTYAVNLVGANSNIGDVLNLNEVQVRSSNSAGLAIPSVSEYASFNGGVWIDVASTRTTTTYPSGTEEFPVNNLADAIIIAEARGFSRLNFASDFTFGATDSISNYELVGKGAQQTTLTFTSGSSLANCEAVHTEVTGTVDGMTGFENCLINTLSSAGLAPSSEDMLFKNCYFKGTTSLPSNYSGVITAVDCWALPDAGDFPPIIDMGDSTADLQIRNWSGLIELQNCTNAVDVRIFFASGGIELDSTVTAGNLLFSGVGTFVDNSTSVTSLDVVGLISKESIALASAVHYGTAQGAGTGSNQIQLATTASSTDGSYDPSLIVIRDGTGQGQARMVYEYDGTTKTATIDRNWKVNPDNTSVYAVLPAASREHVNEGLSQGGTASTIILNTLASTTDDYYNGQLVFIRSGTGDDQVRLVIDYDGATQTATINHDWDTTPDTTSAYAMLPAQGSVWDELTVNYTTAGTTGKALSDAGASGNPWATPVSGNTTAGSFGELVGKKLLTIAKFLGLK